MDASVQVPSSCAIEYAADGGDETADGVVTDWLHAAVSAATRRGSATENNN
jgi:hypothetical protein